MNIGFFRQSFLPRFIHRLKRPVALFSSSRLITKMIFGVEVSPYPHPSCQNWDLTTPILKKVLDEYVRPHHRVLEMGTGHSAILSIHLARKKREVRITAVDINPQFIQNARRNALKNQVPIRLKQSDLFSDVEGTFDIIFFNPPYVPRAWMLTRRKDLVSHTIMDCVWDGGDDGCQTIRKFLKEVGSFIHSRSRVLLSVNSLFVSPIRMKGLIIENHLTLERIVSCFWTPSKVYILKKSIPDRTG